MSYLDKILERANIQSFREYLLHGDSLDNIDNNEFQKKEERLKQAYQNCLEIIKFYDTTGEKSELYSVVMDSISEYQDIYTEIGLQAGMKFMRNALCQQNEIQSFHYKRINRENELDRNTIDEHERDNYSYEKMSERINLQSIGCYLKDGSQLKNIDKHSYAERQYQAETELDKELNKILDEDTLKKVSPLIINYAFVHQQIQFSLGMKAGAKLTQILTDDFNYDY